MIEIGGTDVMSYDDVMREYARQRGLRAAAHPGAGADAVSLEPVARPHHAHLRARRPQARREPSHTRPSCEDDSARRASPSVQPMGLRRALARALRNEDRDFAATRWNDAALRHRRAARRMAASRFGSRLVDSRAVTVPVPPAAAFAPILRDRRPAPAGTTRNALWRVRGFLDIAGRRRRASAAAGATPSGSPSAMRSISGASSNSNPTAGCCSAAEMQVPGRAGSSSRSTPAPGRLDPPANRHLRARRTLRPGVLVRHLSAARVGLPLACCAALRPGPACLRGAGPRNPVECVAMRRLCVFCGSSTGRRAIYADAARALGDVARAARHRPGLRRRLDRVDGRRRRCRARRRRIGDRRHPGRPLFGRDRPCRPDRAARGCEHARAEGHDDVARRRLRGAARRPRHLRGAAGGAHVAAARHPPQAGRAARRRRLLARAATPPRRRGRPRGSSTRPAPRSSWSSRTSTSCSTGCATGRRPPCRRIWLRPSEA